MKKNSGFSVLEILAAIAIGVLLASVTVSVFSRLSNGSSLDRDSQIVLSFITKARTEALDSVGGQQHGVKLTAGGVSIFSGTSYALSGVESSYSLPGSTSISAINLSNATTTFYFNKLTGDPSATGTVVVTTGTISKTITIYGTGIAEIQ